MNILRHKSWHVRTKKNIARVRRDEENARKEEEAKQLKADNAEKSARIEFLRKKSGNSSASKDDESLDQTKLTFELFEDHKDKVQVDRDKDDEKKIEQEKWEVKAGIFSFLDGRHKHDNNKNDEDQWYTKSSDDRRHLPEEDVKDNNVKRDLDPFEKMKQYNKKIELNRSIKKAYNSNETTLKTFPGSCSSIQKYHERTPIIDSTQNHKRRTHRKDDDDDDNDDDEGGGYSESGDKRREKRRRHSKKKKYYKKTKKRASDSGSDSDVPVSASLMDKLRQERLERERKAQEQTRIVLNLPDTSTKDSRKYNAQYNPHLVKKS